MSNEKRKKSINSLLPSINYKHISLVLLLLVTFTSSSIQTPLTHYDCPSGCVCDETKLSARCNNVDALVESYSIKTHHHVATKNFMPIKSLDLSNNQLTKISNHLELLANLTELNLSHNQLTQVHKLHFEHLETLDLSHNRITSAKLAKIPKNVVHLKLSNNEITYLPSDFMKLKKLRSLELTENPLNCTCDTLMIRNWITYQHVWSDEIIKCASPQIFKGQPWLQARQNDICLEPSSTTPQSKYNWDDFDNDVMMNDDPNAYHGGGEDGDGDDYNGTEINKDATNIDEYDDYDSYKDISEEDEFVEDDATEPPQPEEDEEKPDEEKIEDEYEYSENHNIFDEQKPETESEKPDTESEKPLSEDDGVEEDFIPMPTSEAPIHKSSEATDVEVVSESTSEEGSGEASPEPIIIEDSDGSGSGFGDFGVEDKSTLGIFENEPETTLAPVIQKGGITGNEETPPVGNDPQTSDINKAKVEDNTGTYILLVIIGVLLVSLIIFVAMKNRAEKRNNRRRYDVEKNAAATELQEMDKRLLGKPIEKNGNGKHEHSPLINDNHYPKDDGFMPYKTPAITVDEPIQEVPQKDKEKSQQSLYENNLPNGNGNVFEPIEPVHNNGNVPKSPDSDEEVFHPAIDGPDSLEAPVESPKRYSPIYTPISPRSARYSPVYSPETGRVKIKLTETPKPKTPQVVTRSRSRAGDYVNTPNN